MKRIFAFLLACLCTAASFSCGKKTTAGETDGDGEKASPVTVVGADKESARSEVLTGVYQPVDLPLPEGYEAGSEMQNCTPRVDGGTGGITALLTRKEENEDLPKYILATTDAEHGVTETVPLPDLGEARITRWAFDKDGRCFFTAQTTRERSADGIYAYADITLYRFDPPTDGETEWTLSEGLPLNPLFNAYNEFYVNNFITDTDGDLWVECMFGSGSMGRRIVFTPELVQKSVEDTQNNSPMTAIPASAGGGGAVKLNSRTIGARFVAKDGSTKTVELPELPDRVTVPEGGDRQTFYYSSNTGVWRAVLNEKGEASVECLMDFGSSNVKTTVNGSGSDWSFLLSVLSEDCMLFTERHGLTLYTASGDIDLSTLKVIEIAQGVDFHWSTYGWPDLIVEYNKTHPDCRVVLKDYTLYNNSQNPDGGLRKLTTDIVTGIYKPDIVITEYGNELCSVLVRDGLCEDLSPYMAQDDTVNRDNLFDSVERMFSDANGGLWGLASSIDLRGPYTSQSILDKYGPDLTEAGGWSLERMLDFAESLPADVVFYDILRQDNADSILLGPDGYSVFVKDGQAKFDSPLFLRWLNFYASLPKDSDDWMKKTPTGKLQAARDFAGIYDYAYQDRIALQWIGLYQLHMDRQESLFGTKDWVFLGHPAEGYSGVDCRANNCLVMTRWSGEKELAWDVIRTLIADPESWSGGLPTLDSLFDQALERQNLLNSQYIVYFNGSTIGLERDPDLKQEDLQSPGYIVRPEREDFEHLKRILNSVGYPMTEKLNPDVAAIVAEEISTFVGGVGTAEDCAAKIQSRVSILLAERG